MAHLVEAFGSELLRWSLEASLIVLLVLLVKALAGRHWSAKWHSAIWLLLVLRLSLPWLSVPLLLGRQLLVSFRLWRAVRKGRILTSEPVLEMLESCKAAMDVHTMLGVVITDRVPGPALFGFLRPRLLLPQDALERLTREELRHVFLHELAHLKRMDIHWGWLSALLQVLHWFNPLVWYGFMRMRRDRELACDELAVAALPFQEVTSYGRTLLALLEAVPMSRLLPGCAAVCEDASNLKRRILQIASFQTERRPWWRQTLTALTFTAVAFCAFSIKLRSFETGSSDTPARVDKIDYPFVDDPELLGGWRGVDHVTKPADFDPAKKPSDLGIPYRERDLLELVVKAGGKTSWSAENWTKGLFLNPVDLTASRYEILEIQGHTYLFMEWKSGDYTYRGATPKFYVLEKDPRVVDVETRVEDKIDFPFVDDPEAKGTWTSVGFVNTIEQFQPGRKYWRGDLFLKGMELLDGGKTRMQFANDGGKNAQWCSWTKGLVIDPIDHTAAHYQIQTLQGRSYLFMEWKSGDYIRGKRAPSYCVMTR